MQVGGWIAHAVGLVPGPFESIDRPHGSWVRPRDAAQRGWIPAFSGHGGARCNVGRTCSRMREIADRLRSIWHGDGGMSTAEYAIGTIAAAAFAALLYTVVTSDAVTEAMSALVREALKTDF